VPKDSYVLSIWVVYDHPSDMPDYYVARRWEVRGSHSGPTDDVLTAPTLGALRSFLVRFGLYRLDRNEGDDAKIVESWL